MSTKHTACLILSLVVSLAFRPGKKTPTIYIVGDSTVMDYETYYDDYMEKAFPLSGWGQELKSYMNKDSLTLLKKLLRRHSAMLENRAIGGRSTRSFFQEGRWRKIYNSLRRGDLVLIQMGHNDATSPEIRPNRAVTPEAYQEFLRLFVSQSREKGARPILITPVNQDKWENGVIQNSHGKYYEAMVAVSKEMDCDLIDLTVSSMAKFQEMGQEYVSTHYFMNLPAGKFKSHPEGLEDHTHFQTEGAKMVAQLVFDGLKNI